MSSVSSLDLAPEGVDPGVELVRDLLEGLVGLPAHYLEASGICLSLSRCGATPLRIRAKERGLGILPPRFGRSVAAGVSAR